MRCWVVVELRTVVSDVFDVGSCALLKKVEPPDGSTVTEANAKLGSRGVAF